MTEGTTMPLSTVAGWSWRRKECKSADVLYLVVENATQSRFTDKKQKVPTGTPYEIDVWEQPPISNISDLSASLGNDWVLRRCGRSAGAGRTRRVHVGGGAAA